METTHYGQAMRMDRMATYVEGAVRFLTETPRFPNAQAYYETMCASSDTDPFVPRHPLFIYTGMSGVAAVTAVAMRLREKHPNFKFNMAYIRKEDEKSHGSHVEFALMDQTVPIYQREKVAKYLRMNCYYVFLDDCIDSGATFHRCIDTLNTFLDQALFDASRVPGATPVKKVVSDYSKPRPRIERDIVALLEHDANLIVGWERQHSGRQYPIRNHRISYHTYTPDTPQVQ